MEIEKKENLKKIIREKLEGVKKQIKSFELLTQPVSPDNAIGRITRMEAIQNKSVNEATLKKSKILLSRLEHSLSAIDDSDYGLCQGCDEPIPYARLMAVPETQLCIQCAESLNG